MWRLQLPRRIRRNIQRLAVAKRPAFCYDDGKSMSRGGIRRHGHSHKVQQPQPAGLAMLAKTRSLRHLSAWPARLPKTSRPTIRRCLPRRPRLRRRRSCPTARAKASSPSTPIPAIVRNGRRSPPSPSSTTTCRSCSIRCSARSPIPPASRVFVTHPVIAVKHGKKGVGEILADGAKDQDVDRLSVIHIHINALSADEARGLKERLGKVLDAGARRGRRLEADAGAARPRDLGVPLSSRSRSPRTRSPRPSPSSNGCATTISPSSACASSAIPAARRAAR